MIKKMLCAVFLSVFAGLSIHAQNVYTDTLTLETCFYLLEQNYPLQKKNALIEKNQDLIVSNLNKTYLPTFAVTGDLSYQSEVPSIDILYINPDNKLRYGLNLDINQTVFDAGISAKKKKITVAEYETEKQNIKIEIDKVKLDICDLFYNIALLEEYISQLQLTMGKLMSKKGMVKSAVVNGSALNSELNVVKVEILKLEGLISEKNFQKKLLIHNMSLLLGEDLNQDTYFQLNDVNIINNLSNKREELKLFEYQQNRLSAAGKLYSTYLPNINGFARVGYGNPCYYDIFSEKAHPYLFVGLKMNWMFWDWDNARNERKKLDINKDKLNIDKELFEMGLKISSNSFLDEIERYNVLIENDKKIIKLQEDISMSAESQYNNGEFTFSEYYDFINAELTARIELKRHEIMLLRAKTNFLLNLGFY